MKWLRSKRQMNPVFTTANSFYINTVAIKYHAVRRMCALTIFQIQGRSLHA